MLLKRRMGLAFTEPQGSPNLTGFRLVNNKKKDEVLQSFSRRNSMLRLVIATTAFGMGIIAPILDK